MRVKICGLMRSSDVQAAVNSGADAVGFVVASPSSPRNLTLAGARNLMRLAPVFIAKVAVTVADDTRTIHRICTGLNPNAVQFHHHNRKIVKQIRKLHPEMELILASAIRDETSLIIGKKTSVYADAVLADSPGTTGMGGTGIAHNWELTAALRNEVYPRPLILAGGLTPANVQAAIRKVRPYAVDVSTGVEERVGVKDHLKISEFISNAKETVN